MLRPILLTSAKVPNDLEIYPTFNVGNYTQWNHLSEEDARITAYNNTNYYFSHIRP